MKEAYAQYGLLLRKLVLLADQDAPEADAIREEMAYCWNRMSEGQRQLARELSVKGEA